MTFLVGVSIPCRIRLDGGVSPCEYRFRTDPPDRSTHSLLLRGEYHFVSAAFQTSGNDLVKNTKQRDHHGVTYMYYQEWFWPQHAHAYVS